MKYFNYFLIWNNLLKNTFQLQIEIIQKVRFNKMFNLINKCHQINKILIKNRIFMMMLIKKSTV